MLKYLFLVLVTVFVVEASAARMSKEVREQCLLLKSMSQSDLDSMYMRASPGQVPVGPTNGCVVGWPQTLLNLPITNVMNAVWTGKVFNGETATLKNRVLGVEAVSADVYVGKSLLDGKQSIIVDYNKEIYPFSLVRDEIRQVSPGVYLGRAYLKTLAGTILGVNFALFQ